MVSEDRVLNPEGLRFADEFVRHKVLDAIGDLALAGQPLLAAYKTVRGGHKLNHAVLSALMADPSAWRVVEAAEPAAPRARPVPSLATGWWPRPMGRKCPENLAISALTFALIRAECRLSRMARAAHFRIDRRDSRRWETGRRGKRHVRVDGSVFETFAAHDACPGHPDMTARQIGLVAPRARAGCRGGGREPRRMQQLRHFRNKDDIVAR